MIQSQKSCFDEYKHDAENLSQLMSGSPKPDFNYNTNVHKRSQSSMDSFESKPRPKQSFQENGSMICLNYREVPLRSKVIQ